MGRDDRLVAGRHALRRAGAGGVHDDLRHPPPRQRRAARGHGRGHRLRVRSSSSSPSSPSGVFVTWGLFDGMDDIWARAQAFPELRTLLRLGGEDGAHVVRLRAVVRADDARDALGAAAAAPVPDDGRRMRRRAAPAAGRLGLPRLSAADQCLRPADRDRRAGALRPGADGRRDLRAVAAARPWRAGAGAIRLCRRPVRGYRNADRRDDRRLDDGLQRPGHAVPAAAARPSARARAAT